MGEYSFGATNIVVQEYPSGGWGIHTSRGLATGKAVKGRKACHLVTVLTAHPKTQAVLGRRTLNRMIFWIALPANIKARATDITHLGGKVGGRRRNTYLRPSP